MFNDKRKGMELSINTMIIMVLALLVLGVMAYLIISGTLNWNKGTKCENQGGKCVDAKSSCSDVEGGKYPVPSAYTCEKDQKCCINIGGLGDS